MKPHQQAFDALESKNLTLKERKSTYWSGGLTAWVEYCAINPDGKVLASAGFHYNRHPATYQHQGLYAYRNTARYEALDSIVQQLGTPQAREDILN